MKGLLQALRSNIIVASKQLIEEKKALLITDTAEYLHEYRTQPTVTSEDRMTHAIQSLFTALEDGPASLCDSELVAIEAVRAIFANWRRV